MKIKSIVLLVFICFSNALLSQTKQKDTLKAHKLDEVVVTAQFTPTSEKKAVYKVHVINRKTIEAKAASNLAELLQQELNIELSQNSAFGSSLELRGMSKENIKILKDGVPLIGRVNGVLNLNQINLDNIEKIEVIEGPVSVFYGTDAMGGTINLITKNAVKNNFEGNFNFKYETVESRDVNGSLAAQFNKNTVRVNVGKNTFNGLRTDDKLKRKLNWPNRNFYYGNAMYVREIGNFKVRLTSDYSEEKVAVLGEVKTSTQKAKDIDYITNRFDNALNVQGKIGANNFLNATVSYLDYNRFDNTYSFNKTTNTQTLKEVNVDGNRFKTLFSKVQFGKNDKADKLNYAIGAEYQSDKGEGDRILDESQTVENTSVFASLSYKVLAGLVVQPAVRYTQNSAFDGLFSPAFNLKYKVNNHSTVRFGYANGFRAPSIKELYLNWSPTFGPFTYHITGNEDLDVETSHNFNIHYTYFNHYKKYGGFVIEPSVFYNETKDLIGLSNMVNFSRNYINLKESKTLSANLNVKYMPVTNLTVNLGFSYLGRYYQYSEKFDSDGFLYTPSANASISYTYKPFDITLNSFYKFVGKKDGHYIKKVSGTPTLFESTRDSFSNLEFSLSKRLLNKKMLISVGAKNIFDVTDVESFNQIGVAHDRDMQFWGASYFVQTKFRF